MDNIAVRWGIYLLIIAACLGFLYAIKAPVVYQPHGIFLPTKFSTLSSDTGESQVIGHISVLKYHTSASEAQQENTIAAYAKTLATSHGATGLKDAGLWLSKADGAIPSTYYLRAKAVR